MATASDPTRRDSSLGRRLRAARERLGWSREALAYRSSLSWSAIEQIESGRRRDVRLKTLAALASTLGVSIDYLVEGTAVSQQQMLRHAVLFYNSDEEYLATTVSFLAEALRQEGGALAVTSREKIELLKDALGDSAPNVEFADATSWYRAPGAALGAYRAFVSERLDEGASWVRIVGEPVWKGRRNDEVRVWTRYESVINLALASLPLSILCPYDRGTVDRNILADADHTHPEMVAGARQVKNPAYRDPAVFVLDSDT